MFTLSLHQFNSLDTSAKATEVVESGCLIGDRFADGYKVLVYQLHSFFVEIGLNEYTDEIGFIHHYSNIDTIPHLLTVVNDPD